MALTTTTVNYSINLPAGVTPPNGGSVTFTLSAAETDDGLVVPASVTGSIAADGSGTVALWPNERGRLNTVYDVTVTLDDGAQAVTYRYGTIRVPDQATADLDELFGVPIATLPAYAFDIAADALLAQRWANEAEDVAVTPGEYSAMHWALKAQAAASDEYGSNANGQYVKLEDGTLINWTDDGADLACTTAAGGIYDSGADSSWTFPMAFANTKYVSGADPDSTKRWGTTKRLDSTSLAYRQMSGTSSASAVNTRLFAIGRWK